MINALWLLGYLLIVLCYIPQISQMVRTKSVMDINLHFLWFLWMGVVLVELYALSVGDVGYILGHSATLVGISTMLALYYRYRKRPPKFKPPW